jgi:O-acetyl-ADP-ribose deacetylase (regulator of RNase III)/ADP-ribose pyrophosphatase YjhB (NUDIX family)
MNIRGIEITVVKADLTQERVDAIVNAANNELVMGGGVAGAIKRKGGEGIEREATAQGPIRVGEAVVTGAGKLPANFVIHAATMAMDFKTDEDKIRAACRSALARAQERNLSSIAFPALGCGTGGFPALAAAKIMAQEILAYARLGTHSLKEVRFCLADDATREIFEKGVIGYLTHVREELQWGPFLTVDAIIEMPDDSIIVIKRSNPPFGLALPGGFVDYGESLEDAVVREAFEETGMRLSRIRQMHTYSNPARDARFHTVCTVFVAQGVGVPQAGDDAAELLVMKLADAPKQVFAFDHATVISDYCAWRKGNDPFTRDIPAR